MSHSSSLVDFEESCRDAQRAAVESVHIGRETLQQAQQQKEQLHRASNIADETQYGLDQAARLLKNMTWSGWIANKFTKEPSRQDAAAAAAATREPSQVKNQKGPLQKQEPTGRSTTPAVSVATPSSEHERAIPRHWQPAFQALQNYRANLQVLQDCHHQQQDADQLETCQMICTAMYQAALSNLAKITSLASDDDNDVIRRELRRDLEQLRQRQDEILQEQPRRSTTTALAAASKANSTKHIESPSTHEPSTSTKAATTSPHLQRQQQTQDQHLEILSSNLHELGHLAQHLQETVHSSIHTMDHLQDQSDIILEQTKHVTRRADRLARHKQGWIRRAVTHGTCLRLLGRVALQHVDSGYYLRMSRGTVFLIQEFQKASCVVGIYSAQRQQPAAANGNGAAVQGLVGIKNMADGTWLGQSLLGSLDASATSFGHRQEWELDEGISLDNVSDITVRNRSGDIADASSTATTRTTRLLCASAGWGTGGYLLVGPAPHFAITIGGASVDDRKKAALWRLLEQPL